MSVASRFTALLAASLATATLAAAQPQNTPPRPDRPYAGLFGGNRERPRDDQELNLQVSFYGAYDDNVLADRGQGGVDPMLQQSGGYGGGDMSLDFVKRSRRGSLDFSAGTSYRYYPSLSELTGFNHWGSIGFGWEFSGRTSLHATETVGYSPYYGFGNFPGLAPAVAGEAAPTNRDYSLLRRPAVMFGSLVSFDHRVTRRLTWSLDGAYSRTDFRDAGYRPFENWGAGSGLSYRLTSNASLRLGYHYRRNTYSYFAGGRPTENHDIDAGVDYSRSLSFSRRTRFGFATGSTIYRSYLANDTGSYDPTLYRTRYMVTGTAYLNREIGRSWNARLDYRRGAGYVEGFPQLFFSDSVAASLAGLAGTRTHLSFGGAYTTGEVGPTGINHNYATYTGSAQLQLALSRSAAVFAGYSFYHYRFDAAVVLPPGMARSQDRNSIRAGLSLWLPLTR